MNRLFSRARGFTLIELLTVIAIIALLASIIMASLTTARQKSRDAKRIADIKNLELALSLYYNDKYAYPTTLQALAPNYTPSLPTDPSQSGSCTTGAQASCYTYSALGSGTTCTSFHLGASLEQTGNTALQSDTDSAAGTACTGSAADFSGMSNATGGSKCNTTAGTPQPGGTETCYDTHS